MGAGKLTVKDERSCHQDVEIEPLSGKPFFHAVLQKSHVGAPYQLILPAKFSQTLPLKKVIVILTYGSRRWEVPYHGDHPTHKRFNQNWKAFVVDNALKVGDACVFELMESESQRIIKFKVQILRGDFPSELLEVVDGTKEKPVVLD